VLKGGVEPELTLRHVPITGSTWGAEYEHPNKACEQTSGFGDDPISADAGRGEDCR
jgi:hypothetical protein